MTKGMVQLSLAVLLLLAALYCLMWTVAAGSLSFVDCKATSSLFHEIPRCRQSSIAWLLFLSTSLAAIVFFMLGTRSRLKARRQNKV